MDKFLRDSLDGLELNPSQSVWKKITKRLLLLEIIRLNFTNIGKTWLYSGLATVATISGLTFYTISQPTETSLANLPDEKVEQTISPSSKEKIQINETISTASPIADHDQPSLASEITEETIGNVSATEKVATPPSQSTQTSKATIAKTEKINAIDPNPTSVNHPSDINQRGRTPLPLDQISYFQIPINSAQVELTGVGRGRLKSYTILEEDEEEPAAKTRKSDMSWAITASYTPEWPLSNEEMHVFNNQFAIQLQLDYKKWDFSLGLGLKAEKTPSMFLSNYQSYDSVGFYYNIDHYDVVPGYPDSIIIYYTLESLYDSVSHQSEAHGPEQKRKWFFIPLSIGYQLYSSDKYELYAHLFGQYGWQYYTEKANLELKVAENSSMVEITPEVKANYMQLGIGFENNFNIRPHWWIFAEPRINYYINTPYIINNSSGNGPFSFGLKVGIKYKFDWR